jgi:protein-S-isoprenylcysteine O-methyltransferase Ste14
MKFTNPITPLKIFLGIGILLGSLWITNYLDRVRISDLNPSVPLFPIQIVGAFMIIIWLPIFLTGIFFLKNTNPSQLFRTTGIYRFTRNPIDAGFYATLSGTGLILANTGITIAGILGFMISWILCKEEERKLITKFSENYIDYKNKTPRMIPNFPLLVKTLSGNRSTDEPFS